MRTKAPTQLTLTDLRLRSSRSLRGGAPGAELKSTWMTGGTTGAAHDSSCGGGGRSTGATAPPFPSGRMGSSAARPPPRPVAVFEKLLRRPSCLKYVVAAASPARSRLFSAIGTSILAVAARLDHTIALEREEKPINFRKILIIFGPRK